MDPPARVARHLEETQRELALPPVVEDTTPAEGFHIIATVARGRPPRQGLQPVPFVWTDVLGTAPPEQDSRSRPYAVYHATEVDDHVRLVHQTLVRLEPQGDVVHAESRLHVQRRALLETMEAQRAKAHARHHRWQRRITRRHQRQRAKLAKWPRPLAVPALVVAAVLARVAKALNDFLLGTVRAVVEMPDTLLSAALRAEALVLHPSSRRSLWGSLREPDQLSAEEKSVVVFLSLVLLGVGVLLLNSVMALAFPEHAPLYRGLLANALVQFVSVFGLPIVMEPLLIFATLTQGPVLAFSGFFIGKMLGVWVLYFLGDSLHDTFERKASPKWKQRMAWLNRKADKHGFVILFLDNALPLMPDQVLWVFAVSGMRFRTWLLAVALGTAVKFAVIVGGVYLVGPERIEQFFSNPFG